MRVLVWITVGFACACAVFAYGNSSVWLLALAAICIMLALWLMNRKTEIAHKLRIAVLGCILGILFTGLYQWLYLSPAIVHDGELCDLEIASSQYSYRWNTRTVTVGTAKLDGRTYRMKIYLKEQTELAPGDRVSGCFSMRYTGHGGKREPTHHRGEGIVLLAYAQDAVTVTKAESLKLRHIPGVLAHSAKALIRTAFPEDTAPFATALLLGDDSTLPYAQDKALQISGIRHIIAVSGLHISILFSMIYILCRRRQILTAVIGMPILFLFAAMAGFTPSVVRACIMQCLMLLALALNKEYDPPTALAFAVLGILVHDPCTVTSAGFQLSVGCVAGILLFSQPVYNYLLSPACFGQAEGKGFYSRCKRWIAGSLCVSLSTMVVTVPLGAFYFGTVSLVGILSNLLTLWIVTAIFYGLLFFCAVGGLFPGAAQGIAGILSWPIRYVLMISDTLSKLPFAAVFTNNIYILLWLVFAYVLLAVFLKNKRRHPKLLVLCLAVGLAVSAAFGLLERKQGNFRVTVMDVGQGQCILLETRQERYLVDCGSSSESRAADTAVRELLSRGIFSLDGVIVTHYDKDHVSGINALLSRIPAKTLYLPDIDANNDLRGQILRENGDRVQWVRQTDRTDLTDACLTLFPSSEQTAGNESGLCILFQPVDYDILITGDRNFSGEEELLGSATLPQLELLVAGHHGSERSTGWELLRQTMPATVVISVGKDNTYGHPSPQTLERLELFGCEVLRTDEMGTITFWG